MPWSWKPLVLLLEPSLSIRGTCMSIWEWITGLQWLTCWRWGETRSPFIARDSPGTVGLCLKQADNSDCRISAWGFEPRSRLAVNKFPGFEQLETKPYSFPVTKSSVGSPDNRSVCRSHEYSASDLYHLVSRPIGAKDGCLSDHLVTVFLLSQWYVAVWQRSKRFTQWLFS